MTSTSYANNNLATTFADLATYDELETYLYGGADAVTLFVRNFRKATWFSQAPCQLMTQSQADFGKYWQAKVNRAGDYMLQTWLRFRLPQVQFLGTAAGSGDLVAGRWCQNIGHNIIRSCSIEFNSIQMTQFDNYYLDFWAAFTTPAGKQVGYLNMIGAVSSLTNPAQQQGAATTAYANLLPDRVINVPLPMPYSRDSGVSLPTAALPYNEIYIDIEFRNWYDLLLYDDNTAVTVANVGMADVGTTIGTSKITAVPQLSEVAVWANYAVVSNDERKKMGKAPRDIIIEQVQRMSAITWNTPATQPQTEMNLRYSHAVKVMFFGVRNTTITNEYSNYTTRSVISGPGVLGEGSLNSAAAGTPTLLAFPPPSGSFPIGSAELSYESSPRLSCPVDYYALVNPWYTAPTIPVVTGYLMYSYSMWFFSIDPKGSTNYGKLTNVILRLNASNDCQYAAAGKTSAGVAGVGYSNQTFEIINEVVNHNVIRVSGGARFSEGADVLVY